MAQQQPDSWKNKPTNSEIHRAYLAPQEAEHWVRIENFVLTGGFGVEPNPHEKSKDGASLPEFKVTWPTPEKKQIDYKIFFEACRMIIGTLNLDDEVFAKSTTPKIFETLSTSTLFTELYSKRSATQGNTVQHHVETVPTLVKTNASDLKERFILRTTAVFHDIGKAFNIGRDQVHYHALISSNIVSWFMDEYKDHFVDHLTKFDNRSRSQVMSIDAEGKPISTEDENEVDAEFSRIRNQITETIRLHHVLEQIDKGVLDLDTVAEIFADNKIASATYGLFAIADGVSVVPDNEVYAKYLIQNINHLFRLLDLLAEKEYIESGQEAQKIKLMYAQSTLAVMEKVIDGSEKAQELLEKVKAIIKEISETIDSILARALLSM